MRISATRKIARVLAGSEKLFHNPKFQPDLLLIELAGESARTKKKKDRSIFKKNFVHGEDSNTDTFHFLHKHFGYTEVYHSGPTCENFRAHLSGATWCGLDLNKGTRGKSFEDITEALEEGSIENVLMFRKNFRN